VLAGLNPQLAAIADIECELAEGQPRRALELIAALPNDPQSERVSDLEATARAESGDTAGALAILENLSRLRPESAALKLRLAELRDRMSPRPESPSAVAAVAGANHGQPVSTNPDSLEARLTRARDFAAAEQWTASLEAVDAALAADPHAPAALKLRAEVLSWSGRHADAVKAYDVYLGQAPQDVEAKRQQARVLGWGGLFSEAKRRYASLVREYSGDARIAAEAAAKTAFYDGRWSAAAEAYQRWLALEPDNTEARFEHAESLAGRR
jgi:tetratricopeptide (TPR) repeat protein